MKQTILSSCALILLATAALADPAQDNYTLAADYSAKSTGHAVLVMIDGKVVFERYDNGHTADKVHRLASGTKSFWGLAVVAAQEDGLLTLDEKVCDTLTEWKSDPAKSPITIRQLLSLCSGIEGGKTGSQPPYAEAIKSKVTAPVGTKFQYGPIPYQCFGELMRRKLAPRHISSVDYLKARVLNPIGMEIGFWTRSNGDQPSMPAGAMLTARQWVKFGELVRLKGNWNGKQIVKPESLAECFKPAPANASYGMTWWLLGHMATDKDFPKDAVMAAGLGKQRCYVIPSLKMVVVRFGETEGNQFNDAAFLGLLLRGKPFERTPPTGT